MMNLFLFCDDEVQMSDIDTTPMAIHVKCSSCQKVEEVKIIGEDLGDYTLNDDGTYTSLYDCAVCIGSD
jgi:hypothetical protein